MARNLRPPQKIIVLGFLEIVSALQEVLKNAKIATLFTFFEIRLLEGMSDNNWCWQSIKKEYFFDSVPYKCILVKHLRSKTENRVSKVNCGFVALFLESSHP